MLVRQFLKNQGDVVVAGEARDGREAVAWVGLHHPDVVVMDVDMPNLDGVGAAAEITRIAPATKVVMYSANVDPALIDRAFAAGALGYVAKTALHELLAAIRAAKNGHLYFHPA